MGNFHNFLFLTKLKGIQYYILCTYITQTHSHHKSKSVPIDLLLVCAEYKGHQYKGLYVLVHVCYYNGMFLFINVST